jgi:hypothetical protein
MFHLHCARCGAWTTVPDLSDPDAALQCSCCTLDHHHGQAANACPGITAGHPGVPCHQPEGGTGCSLRTPPGEPCPGGHCTPGDPGCQVCRPITITPLPGSVQVAGVKE